MHYFLRNNRMNTKIHHFPHKVACIRSDYAGAVAKFHIHGFLLLRGFDLTQKRRFLSYDTVELDV